MFKRLLVGTALIACGSLTALSTSERISADTSVFIEGAPLSEGITALHSVVSNVAGEGVWSMMAANFEQRAGFNPLDPEKLEELGINTRENWGLAINVELDTAGKPAKPRFVLIVPAKASGKFYAFVKDKITEGQMPLNKEIEPGRLLHFGAENDPGYLLKTDGAVLISNNLDLVKAAETKNSDAMSSAEFYLTMRAHLLARSEKKQPMLAFYINPKLILASMKSQTDLIQKFQKEAGPGGEGNKPLMNENSPYLAEIRDNLRSAGGAFVVSGERLSAYFSYNYKEGYLSDESKMYPRIIQVKAKPLSSDMLARNPVHYSLLKLNAMPLIDLLKSLSPAFAEKYEKGLAEIKDKAGVDLEKDIISSLRGNYNFHVLGIPPESKNKDIQAWEIYGSYGINPGTAKNWVNLFKAGEKLAKKAEAKKKKKTRFEFSEASAGTYVTVTVDERIRGKNTPVSVVFLIRENEIIVSNTKAHALKATRSTSSTLSQRLLRVPYETTQGIFYLDLQQIFKAVSKMREGASLKAYANMLEKLKSFSINSSVQGDFATAETTLQLKK
jgi:hypothetical protein